MKKIVSLVLLAAFSLTACEPYQTLSKSYSEKLEAQRIEFNKIIDTYKTNERIYTNAINEARRTTEMAIKYAQPHNTFEARAKSWTEFIIDKAAVLIPTCIGLYISYHATFHPTPQEHHYTGNPPLQVAMQNIPPNQGDAVVNPPIAQEPLALENQPPQQTEN
jgi:hypothetical protein